MVEPIDFHDYLKDTGSENALWEILIELDKMKVKPDDPVEYIRENLSPALTAKFTNLKEEIEATLNEISQIAEEYPQVYNKFLKIIKKRKKGFKDIYLNIGAKKESSSEEKGDEEKDGEETHMNKSGSEEKISQSLKGESGDGDEQLNEGIPSDEMPFESMPPEPLLTEHMPTEQSTNEHESADHEEQDAHQSVIHGEKQGLTELEILKSEATEQFEKAPTEFGEEKHIKTKPGEENLSEIELSDKKEQENDSTIDKQDVKWWKKLCC